MRSSTTLVSLRYLSASNRHSESRADSGSLIHRLFTARLARRTMRTRDVFHNYVNAPLRATFRRRLSFCLAFFPFFSFSFSQLSFSRSLCFSIVLASSLCTRYYFSMTRDSHIATLRNAHNGGRQNRKRERERETPVA